MAFRGISSILKTFHLRPVKKVKFSFDPYTPNVRSIREILSILHMPKVLATNDNVTFKVDVLGNRCEPTLNVDFGDGVKLVVKTQNLSTLEILQSLNKFCVAKDVKKEEPSSISTKLEKKRRK